MPLLLLLACATPEDKPHTAADTDTCTDADADAVRTLDNCGSTIADDVPAFFATWFRCVTMTMSGADVVIGTENLPPHRRHLPWRGDAPRSSMSHRTEGCGFIVISGRGDARKHQVDRW